MRTLTIGTTSLASAQGFLEALEGFQAELVTTHDGNYQFQISLDETNRSAIEVLQALEQHVTERASGTARLELDGRRYLMDVADAEPCSYLLDVPDREPAPDTA